MAALIYIPTNSVQVYAMDHNSAIEKNETLPFAASWTDLENITLSEISQTKTNTIYHLYMESEK